MTANATSAPGLSLAVACSIIRIGMWRRIGYVVLQGGGVIVSLSFVLRQSFAREVLRVVISGVATMVLASCAVVPEPTPAVRADLAATGKLRAAINDGNFILATRDRASGESRGVAIELANDLGRRLGVPVEFVAFDSVAAMGDAAPGGTWDIAFLGSDPQRESLMSFTPAYLEIEATYLVSGPSTLRAAAEVDRDGVRVAAPARAIYELFLSRHLQHARLVSTPGTNAAFELLATGKVDAVAGLTQGLADRSQQIPGSRLLEGRFMAVQQSIAVPKGRDTGLAYLRYVVEDAKKSGLVARAIEKTGARGVSVAPEANRF